MVFVAHREGPHTRSAGMYYAHSCLIRTFSFFNLFLTFIYIRDFQSLRFAFLCWYPPCTSHCYRYWCCRCFQVIPLAHFHTIHFQYSSVFVVCKKYWATRSGKKRVRRSSSPGVITLFSCCGLCCCGFFFVCLISSVASLILFLDPTEDCMLILTTLLSALN